MTYTRRDLAEMLQKHINTISYRILKLGMQGNKFNEKEMNEIVDCCNNMGNLFIDKELEDVYYRTQLNQKIRKKNKKWEWLNIHYPYAFNLMIDYFVDKNFLIIKEEFIKYFFEKAHNIKYVFSFIGKKKAFCELEKRILDKKINNKKIKNTLMYKDILIRFEELYKKGD